MFRFDVVVISALLIVLCGIGCKDSGGDSAPTTSTSGTIDGTYTFSGLTCNGSTVTYLPVGATSRYIIIKNLTGSNITSFSDGCVSTEGQVFTYPSSTTFTMQKVNQVCSGASCSGSECTANSTSGSALTMTFSVSGSTLTATRTSDGNDGCSTGQVTVYTLTKQ
jgi:hypothetical protein